MFCRIMTTLSSDMFENDTHIYFELDTDWNETNLSLWHLLSEHRYTPTRNHYDKADGLRSHPGIHENYLSLQGLFKIFESFCSRTRPDVRRILLNVNIVVNRIKENLDKINEQKITQIFATKLT